MPTYRSDDEVVEEEYADIYEIIKLIILIIKFDNVFNMGDSNAIFWRRKRWN